MNSCITCKFDDFEYEDQCSPLCGTAEPFDKWESKHIVDFTQVIADAEEKAIKSINKNKHPVRRSVKEMQNRMITTLKKRPPAPLKKKDCKNCSHYQKVESLDICSDCDTELSNWTVDPYVLKEARKKLRSFNNDVKLDSRMIKALEIFTLFTNKSLTESECLLLFRILKDVEKWNNESSTNS